MKKSILFVLVGFVAASAYACGGGGGGMSTEMPVKEAKALNERLSMSYEKTDASWQAAQQNAGQLGELTDVDVKSLDVVNIQTTLTECFEAPIETVEGATGEAEKAVDDTKKGESAQKEAASAKSIALAGYEEVKACPGATETEITSYTANAEDQTGAVKAAKVQQVDMLRKDVLYVLPTNYKTLAEEAPAAIAEVAEIRGKAEAALKATQNNPLASADEKKKAQAQYDEVMTELDSVEELANKIKDDAAAKPNEITSLADEISSDIKNFGQPEGEGEATEEAPEGEGDS